VVAANKYAIFYNDSGGDFAAGFRAELLSRIRELEVHLTPEGDYNESEKILFYLVILTTLVRHVPFEDCINEFVVIDPDEIRELKTKFMAVWEQQFSDSIGGPDNVGVEFDTYMRDHRELTEKTFDDLLEASENPPPPIS